MTTKTVDIKSDEYTKLTSAASFLVQAMGGLKVVVKAAKPGLNDTYIFLKKGEVLTHNQILGTLWGKEAEASSASTVSVTE